MKILRVIVLALCLSCLFLHPPAAAGEAAPAGEIRIGYIAPFTGPAAEFGNNGWRGILLALEDINSRGIRIGGQSYRIRIYKYDSRCAPDSGAADFRRMVTEDHVVAAQDGHCSTVCNAIAPLCDRYRIAGITIECAVDSVTNPGHEFYFRMRPTVKMMIPSVMPKIFKAFDIRTAAFLVVDDGYGDLFVQTAGNELEWRDVRTVAVETFARGSTNFRAQLKRIQKASPDIVFYVGTASEGAVLLTQAKLMGLMPRTIFVGSEEMGEMELPMRAGPDVVDGTYAISLWGRVPPAFEQRVRDRFNKPMHYAIIFGYDATHVLANAIEAAQSLDPVKIKDALKKTDYRALEGHIRFKNFNGYRNQSKFTPSLVRWEEGRRRFLDIFLNWEE